MFSQDLPQDQRHIAAHFAGRISPPAESALRAHLFSCESCRRRYGRHLILAHLDPRGLSAEQRIARGLGFRSAERWRWQRILAGVAIPASAMALLLWLFSVGGGSAFRHYEDDTFAARGRAAPGALTPSVWTYRIAANEGPRLARDWIGSNDELAFAYSNPVGKPYLMIFGVDENRQVYWFHPAWPTGQPAPRAMRASAGPGPHELPAAILHTLRGRRLQVYAAFCDTAIDATRVEDEVRSMARPEIGPDLGPGVAILRQALEVKP